VQNILGSLAENEEKQRKKSGVTGDDESEDKSENNDIDTIDSYLVRT